MPVFRPQVQLSAVGAGSSLQLAICSLEEGDSFPLLMATVERERERGERGRGS